MGTRRWSFGEPQPHAPERSGWRFALGLLTGLTLCGAAVLHFLP